MDIRKVFAVVSTEDFQAFKKRCDKDNSTIGNTLTKLINIISRGFQKSHMNLPMLLDKELKDLSLYE